MASTGVDRVEGVDPSVAIKAPCVVATTGNITLSGAQTIDGVAVDETSNPTRVLVRAQTDSTENGVYDVKGASWTRSEDFNGNRDVVKGTLISIQSGTQYAGATFKVTTDDPIVIGTSNITFATANATDVITVVGTSGIDTYEKMGALTSSYFSDGDVIKCTGDGIFGDFKIKTGTVTDNGGTLIVFSDDSNRYAERVFSGSINAKWFGAVGDGITDNITQINNAISSAGSGGVIYFPYGIYAISNTIVVGYQRTIILDNGAKIILSSALTSSTVPVIFLNGSRSAIAGGGFENSIIKTENACPDGVIKLGATSMSVQTGNTEKCKIEGIRVIGPQLYGQTSGDPDICIHLVAPELSGQFSYFHIIRDVFVEDANIGIWFRGWANGNYVSNIYGVHLGNTTHEGLNPRQNCFVKMSGGLDNMISNMFFNQSNDITGLISEPLDNTSNGSAEIMHTSYNTFSNLVFEQGGTTSNYFMRIFNDDTGSTFTKSAVNNSFIIAANNYNGWTVYSGFYDNNSITNGGTLTNTQVQSNKLIADDEFFVGKTAVNNDDGVYIDGDGVSSMRQTSLQPLLLDRKTTQGKLLDCRYDSAAVGGLSVSSLSVAMAAASVGIGLRTDLTAILPQNDGLSTLDNSVSLGVSGGRWSVVYAATGTINTSDENEKTELQDLSEAEKACANELKTKIKKYKWIDSVNKKGEHGARIHVGVGAQTVKATFEKYGLNADHYALFCSDVWYEKEIALDEGGKFIDTSLEEKPGYIKKHRLGVRYEQILGFIIAAM